MRVFYVLKALQIIVAAVVIFRLLLVSKFCEIRKIYSRSECMGAMKLAIPPLNSDLKIGDAEKTVMAGGLMRPRRMDMLLTKRDPTLEEIHEKNAKSGKGKLDSMEEQKQENVHNAEDAANTAVESKAKNNVAHAHSASIPVPAKVKKPVQDDENHDDQHFSEEVKKKIIKKAVKIDPAVEEKKAVKVEKPLKSRTSKAEEHPKSEEQPKDHHDLKAQENKQEKTKEDKAEKSKENEANAEPKGENIKEVAKTVTLKAAEKSAQSVPSKPPAIPLVNGVYNCLEIGVQDILGFGDIDLSQSSAIRLPLACLVISMVAISVSMIHTFTNLSRPRKCRTFVENVAQILLWSVCGFALFLIRQDWETTWSNSSAGTFEPDFPATWFSSELICYIMVAVFLIETYFYDYCFYKIYVEESLGNYTVVDRPDYGNSIYGSTVEPTENIAL